MILLIGKGRRITLRELQTIASCYDTNSNSSTDCTIQLQKSITTSTSSSETEKEIEENSNNNSSTIITELLNKLCISSTNNNNDTNTNATTTIKSYLSISESIAFLTIVSLSIVQGYIVIPNTDTSTNIVDWCENTANKIIQLILYIKEIQQQQQNQTTTTFTLFPCTTINELYESVISLLALFDDTTNDTTTGTSGTCTSFNITILPLSIIERSYLLSIYGLYIIQSYDLVSIYLPISCISIDSLGIVGTSTSTSTSSSATTTTTNNNNITKYYSEQSFDILHPHRSMITSAATIRSLLNDSRYTTTSSSSASSVIDFDLENTNTVLYNSIINLPQYHGPINENIKSIYKRYELELNSYPLTSTIILDTTLINLLIQQLYNSLLLLYTNCCNRTKLLLLSSSTSTTTNITNVNTSTTENNDPDATNTKVDVTATDTASTILSLKDIVTKLEQALCNEATIAVNKISDIERKVTEESNQNDKGTNAGLKSTQQPTTGNNSNTIDEFAGMTDAQKQKILKKRAEKEAKLAEKKKAKEQKSLSLFGAGTQPVCQILLQSISTSTSSNSNNSSSTVTLSTNTIQQLVLIQEKLLSGGVQRKPKIPKGTRDYLPEQMMIRQQAFTIIRRVFQSHGAVEIDTPIFELKDTLTGKYGEDSKLIYDLADQGGELLALRYDLTVPFARFLSLNNVGNIKRFHIGKVYRRDQPALKRGRYREFYQCDFDIAGVYGHMIPDSECICVICDILYNLPIGNFAIKINHRRLLDAILDICGVPADKFRTICSAIDKLDKEPWVDVKREMVSDKGLDESVADKIGEFVLFNGPPIELHTKLLQTNQFNNHVGALDAMNDLHILFNYLLAFNKIQYIIFDLSLARGLDYYTGVIYEAICLNGNTQVGSIGGGGRYDNLVGMFQDNNTGTKETPCVGVSVGIERVFTLMEEQLAKEKLLLLQQQQQQGGDSTSSTSTSGIKTNNTVSVYIASTRDSGRMIEKMTLAQMLWDNNISAEFNQQDKVTLKKELITVLDKCIPFMIIIGDNEYNDNQVIVKNITLKIESKVYITELVQYLRSQGIIPVGCEFAMELLQKEKEQQEQKEKEQLLNEA